MTTQSCNKCGCPVAWDKLIDKKYTKKDGKEVIGWWREDLSKEIHSKERCENFAKTGDFNAVTKIKVTGSTTFEKQPEQKTNYGEIPEWFTDQAEKTGNIWKGYASLAANLVDEVQPTLDNRTRSMAVSATIDQLVQIEKIRAINSLKESKE